MNGSSHRGLACLGEETLAAFADGRIANGACGRIEAHVADCSDCCAVLARAAGAAPGSESAGPVPADVGAEELCPGTPVGRYRIERRIGRGAMGTVYVAVDPDLDRKVAVKVLRADAWSDSARRHLTARLLREAQSMARLSHPEVITVYDVGALGEQLFVAMEFVDGETLRRWRASRHRSCAEVIAVYERAGSGLAAAHEAGLVHRDFKPDNVLVGRDGRVRVTDFGLARTVDGVDALPRSLAAGKRDGSGDDVMTVSLTRSGTLLGTPAYMAPEQLRGGVADARSDVFSFCVSLYESLYGERPFGGATVRVLEGAIAEGAVRAPPVMTRVPRWVRSVLLRGLRAAPDERFASMRALLDALRTGHAASRRRKGLALGAAALFIAVAVPFALRTRSAPRAGWATPTAPARAAADDLAAGPSPPSPLPPSPSPSPFPESTLVSTAALPALVADLPPDRPAMPSPSATPHGALAPWSKAPAPKGARAAPIPAPNGPPSIGNNGAFILE